MRLTLPATAAAVPRARQEVRDALAALGMQREHPVADTALITLNELVTNCVQHAVVTSATFDIALAAHDGWLGLAVHDRHPYRPEALPEPHADASGGWGLLLVRRLVAEAGGTISMPLDPDGGGKTVVVRLPLHAPGPPKSQLSDH
ncbi:ATP-binding protein [Streptomyces sp. B1866]|uniref:ATP-binding protein n=1 Tax=Streptomyces sp. B1866 TaxID=3075431 RepID=UPI0028904194|nr:ATP-binding protein [Streptomyces sp. B1866]MDT3395121.1 ATP-binding protein [Streptomyces sp. B1866]